jgi:hypothetical protein
MRSAMREYPGSKAVTSNDPQADVQIAAGASRLRTFVHQGPGGGYAPQPGRSIRLRAISKAAVRLLPTAPGAELSLETVARPLGERTF